MAETENNKMVTQKDSSQKPSTLFSFFPKFELSVPFFSKPRPSGQRGAENSSSYRRGRKREWKSETQFCQLPKHSFLSSFID
ncbi:hypothetical protein OIU77_013235 [Salix suchowensis]|uniref:Uncharacterized protein n=1 Tax=Salix suchowensis TaxID=1278906 RepID=A0ABQ8ZT52_9ROSI|nr:hypothetical protein OIU77_013235 [Salix suchowensis]